MVFRRLYYASVMLVILLAASLGAGGLNSIKALYDIKLQQAEAQLNRIEAKIDLIVARDAEAAPVRSDWDEALKKTDSIFSRIDKELKWADDLRIAVKAPFGTMLSYIPTLGPPSPPELPDKTHDGEQL